jgi:hypothetical protein
MTEEERAALSEMMAEAHRKLRAQVPPPPTPRDRRGVFA